MTDLFSYPHHPGAKARDTSFAAADAAAETAPRLRARALAVIERSNGLTADEVAGRLGISILSIRPRISELSRAGKVRDSGDRRPNASGHRAIVWKPVFPARLSGQRTDTAAPAANEAPRHTTPAAPAPAPADASHPEGK